MDKQTLLIGKLLGEVYRAQKNLGLSVSASNARIYGLLRGFEDAIENELDSIGYITTEKVNVVAEVLDEIFLDPQKLDNFKGFYDIESKLAERGVDRGDALVIIKYFKADGKFDTVIEKMNSGHSPSECKTFDLYDEEK